MITGSKKEILDLIKRKGAVSLDEIVTLTDLAKTTLREHLLQLERDGYIDRDYIRSGPGRPRLQYELTSKGNSLFPSFESEMMKELLKFLKSQDKRETIEAFFEMFWDKRLNKARERMDEYPANDPKKRLEQLKKMLQEEGFMPEFELDKENRFLTVKECNCPFSKVVRETSLPCKLEAEFYKKLFNKDAERITYIPDGDYSCTYKIPLEGE